MIFNFKQQTKKRKKQQTKILNNLKNLALHYVMGKQTN